MPRYARVLIETSGLADPAPILHALMTDRGAGARRMRLAGVVTLVDALHGAATLERHPEARRQVMLADRILVTKPDLGHARRRMRVRGAEPGRAAARGGAGRGRPDWLFAPAPRPAELPRLGRAATPPASPPSSSSARRRSRRWR